MKSRMNDELVHFPRSTLNSVMIVVGRNKTVLTYAGLPVCVNGDAFKASLWSHAGAVYCYNYTSVYKWDTWATPCIAQVMTQAMETVTMARQALQNFLPAEQRVLMRALHTGSVHYAFALDPLHTISTRNQTGLGFQRFTVEV